jgi:mono/diheme cytochrome c family protein
MFVLLWGCAQQQPEPPKFQMKPVADVYEVMESIVGHMSQEIFDSVRIEIDASGTHEFKPKDKEAWDEVKFAAKGLAEAGNLLMMEGRAADQGNWAKYSQALIDTSLEAANAAEKQDFEGLMTAGGNIYEHACLACHEEYLEKFETSRLGSAAAGQPVSIPQPK